METIIDRIYIFINNIGVSAHFFEQKCGLSNAYLANQKSGSGTMGCEKLVQILNAYPELSAIWVLTGYGNMILDGTMEAQQRAEAMFLFEKNLRAKFPETADEAQDESNNVLNDDQEPYIKKIPSFTQILLRHIDALEGANADKQKIIQLMQQAEKK
jgi:hypothetical protein